MPASVLPDASKLWLAEALLAALSSCVAPLNLVCDTEQPLIAAKPCWGHRKSFSRSTNKKLFWAPEPLSEKSAPARTKE